MPDKAPANEVKPAAESSASAPAAPATPPKRSPGHRGHDVRDTVAEMAARAHEISLEAGSKMAGTMRDVINAAAGLTGFAIESARDLVQYMVRRGQMTAEEGDKLLREAEEAHRKRTGGTSVAAAAPAPPAKSAAPKSAPKAAPVAATPAPTPRAAEPDHPPARSAKAEPAAAKAAPVKAAPVKAAPAKAAAKPSRPAKPAKSEPAAAKKVAAKKPAPKIAEKSAAKRSGTVKASSRAEKPAKVAAKAVSKKKKR